MVDLSVGGWCDNRGLHRLFDKTTRVLSVCARKPRPLGHGSSNFKIIKNFKV
jgi:hypothetical protein